MGRGGVKILGAASPAWSDEERPHDSPPKMPTAHRPRCGCVALTEEWWTWHCLYPRGRACL